MIAFVYIAAFLLLMGLGFFMGRRRALALLSGSERLHSLPNYHGAFVALAVFLPMVLVFFIALPVIDAVSRQQALTAFSAADVATSLQRETLLRDVVNLATGQTVASPSAALQKAVQIYQQTQAVGRIAMLLLGVGLGLIGFLYGVTRITVPFRARHYVERFVRIVLIAAASVAVLTTIGIVLSVVFESYRFFFDPALKGRPTVSQFLFGLEWNPQAAPRADQGDIQTAYGFIPLLVGSLLITFIAICVAGPLGLLCAIYLAEYASPRVRTLAKPVLEVLAGIPTVVLGFFAALTVAPHIRGWGEALGLNVASESALAAGLVMGMMIIPFISSLSDDVINAVPQALRDGAYAMGATKSETVRQVVLPAALPGIVSAFMLAISRAIGETMIVVMAAGLAANLTINPLQAVTTITVQIKTILVGDQEFDSAKTLAAFALGLSLFFVTLMLNFVALRVVQKYREQYD